MISATVLILGLASWSIAAQAGLKLGPQSKLWLEGRSTLHSYSSTATALAISGEVEIPEAEGLLLKDWARAGVVKSLKVVVEVAGLKSGKRRLDKNMYEALRSKEYPEITFRMSDYEVKPLPGSEGNLLIRARGTLIVAGREKAIILEAHSGSARVSGAQELRMTDFGIKPPTMFLGALKTDDRVVVHYDLALDLEYESGTDIGRKQP